MRFSIRLIPTRRAFHAASMSFGAIVLLTGVGRADEAIDIGSRRELFVDRQLVDRIDGGAELRLHRPEPREVVFTADKPWEGNTSAYFTIFQDGDLYRMYYRGSHWDEVRKQAAHPEVACYAESRDGVHWTKPELGIVEFDGSKNNNIVWNGVGSHCFTPFRDTNPDCAPDARYKAFGRGRPTRPKGLYAFKSPDGIHWSLMNDEAVITDGAFDSQNLAFFDNHTGVYRGYHRSFRDGVRHIMTETSSDFLNWTKPKFLAFPGAPNQHLYTNAVMPYFRAPHLLIAFPTRYLPKEGQRVEPTFMSSRDRETFHRWLDPVIPETAPQDRAGNRSNYMTWGLLQLPDRDRELSVYATEAYYTGPNNRVRRFTYRMDGFVSLHAGEEQGMLISKPVRFKGDRLTVNMKSSPSGSVRIALQDRDGSPIDGYSLADCRPLSGDALAAPVEWSSGAKPAKLQGTAVRLVFELQHADVYSYRFDDGE